MTNPKQREKIARALNEIDECDHGLPGWNDLDETARAYRYLQADAIIALDPAPERAEVEQLRDELGDCAALLINVLEADPGPKAAAAFKAARDWWRSYDATLARGSGS